MSFSRFFYVENAEMWDCFFNLEWDFWDCYGEEKET